MEQTPIRRAIAIAGSQQALATLMTVSQSAIAQWAGDKSPIPPGRAVEIERVLLAKVTCDELLPDARWVRVRDPKWPHKKGRPLLDMTQPAGVL